MCIQKYKSVNSWTTEAQRIFPIGSVSSFILKDWAPSNRPHFWPPFLNSQRPGVSVKLEEYFISKDTSVLVTPTSHKELDVQQLS